MSFNSLDLIFSYGQSAEDDHRMDRLKCVGIMKDTKGRFNYAKNVEFIPMQMYEFIQSLLIEGFDTQSLLK